jgi:hypothetical protein
MPNGYHNNSSSVEYPESLYGKWGPAALKMGSSAGVGAAHTFCPAVLSIGYGDGPDKGQGVREGLLCQSRHRVIRVDDATRALEPLLNHPLGGSADVEVTIGNSIHVFSDFVLLFSEQTIELVIQHLLDQNTYN